MDNYHIISVFLCYQLAGIDQIVLGDLVYCKEACTEKVTGIVKSECEDDSSNDVHDCSHLDEISETDLPEAINNPVKVRCSLVTFWSLYYYH